MFLNLPSWVYHSTMWTVSAPHFAGRQSPLKSWATDSAISTSRMPSSSSATSWQSPKLLYTLWTAPCFLSEKLQKYDGLLRTITSNITKNSLRNSTPAWIQASLPVRQGGLGIRSAAQLAPSTFRASAAGSSRLVSQILLSHLQEAPLVAREAALQCWSRGHDSPTLLTP